MIFSIYAFFSNSHVCPPTFSFLPISPTYAFGIIFFTLHTCTPFLAVLTFLPAGPYQPICLPNLSVPTTTRASQPPLTRASQAPPTRPQAHPPHRSTQQDPTSHPTSSHRPPGPTWHATQQHWHPHPAGALPAPQKQNRWQRQDGPADVCRGGGVRAACSGVRAARGWRRRCVAALAAACGPHSGCGSMCRAKWRRSSCGSVGAAARRREGGVAAALGWRGGGVGAA